MAKVTAQVRFGADRPYSELDDWQQNATGYRVTLRYQRRRLTVDCWMGSALTNEPTAADVLASLVSDALMGEESYEDFCGNLGYDSDSRRAYAAWKQCQTFSTKLRRFLGDDFDTVAERYGDLRTDDDGNVIL